LPKELYNIDMSHVVVAKWNEPGRNSKLTAEEYKSLLTHGLKLLAGVNNSKSALQKYIPGGSVGLKTNCLALKYNSTPVALCDAISDLLEESGIPANDIIVWDRSNRELEKAGFKLNASSFGRRCFGTDSNGVGYSRGFYSFGRVNSLVSRIMTEMVDYNINVPVLKDHSIAGLSAGLKNMYGAINNPNKYHIPNCDPFAAQVSNLEPVKSKNRLIIIDAVKVQYHFGPGYDSRYLEYYNGVILSDDPVAADRIGLEIVEYFRKKHNLNTLAEDKRPVNYLISAAKTGLGENDIRKMETTVILTDNSGAVQKGRLIG